MSKSNLVDVEVVLIHETDKAYKVALGDPEAYTPVWVPKSLCEFEQSQGPSGKVGWGTLTLSEPLAIEKGLV